MPDLESRVQDAFIAWIADTADHGQSIGITARRFEAPKYDDSGEVINPLTLPAIVVNATATRQLHNQLAIYLLECSIELVMQADDTNKDAWDAASEKLETILMEDDLAGKLSGDGTSLKVRGIVTRIPGGKRTENRSWLRPFVVSLWASRAS